MFTIAKFTALTRFEQSLFVLPFVLCSVLLAFQGASPIIWSHLLFIFPAFFAARNGAISFNQFIDREIDSKNPRTKDRPLPSKMVTPNQAKWTSIFSLLVFLLCAFCINFLCFCIGLFVAFILIFYSFMKRIHYSCHFVIGLIHFLAVIGAYLALTGEISFPITILGLIPFFSISGNDILYALQDLDFDRKEGLHSIPAAFGKNRSILISKMCQSLSVIAAAIFGVIAKLPYLYFLAPLILLVIHKYSLRYMNVPKIFFISNTLIGTTILFFLVLWHVL